MRALTVASLVGIRQPPRFLCPRLVHVRPQAPPSPFSPQPSTYTPETLKKTVKSLEEAVLARSVPLTLHYLGQLPPRHPLPYSILYALIALLRRVPRNQRPPSLPGIMMGMLDRHSNPPSDLFRTVLGATWSCDGVKDLYARYVKAGHDPHCPSFVLQLIRRYGDLEALEEARSVYISQCQSKESSPDPEHLTALIRAYARAGKGLHAMEDILGHWAAHAPSSSSIYPTKAYPWILRGMACGPPEHIIRALFPYASSLSPPLSGNTHTTSSQILRMNRPLLLSMYPHLIADALTKHRRRLVGLFASQLQKHYPEALGSPELHHRVIHSSGNSGAASHALGALYCLDPHTPSSLYPSQEYPGPALMRPPSLSSRGREPRGQEVGERTVARVMRALRRRRRQHESIILFRERQASAGIYMWTEALAAGSALFDISLVEALWQEMERSGQVPRPTVVTWTARISVWSRVGKVSRVRELLEEMRSQGIRGNEVTRSVEADALAKSGDWRGAVDLLLTARDPEEPPPDIISLNTALSALNHAGQFKEAYQLWLKMGRWDQATACIILDGCGWARDQGGMEVLGEVWERCEERWGGIPPPPIWYSWVNALGRCGDAQGVVDTLTLLAHRRLQPSRLHILSAFLWLSVLREREKADALIEWLPTWVRPKNMPSSEALRDYLQNVDLYPEQRHEVSSDEFEEDVGEQGDEEEETKVRGWRRLVAMIRSS